MGIVKHEAPVYELQRRQNPHSLDLHELEAAPGNEDADLVAGVQDDEVLLNPNCLTLIWILITHFLAHYVSKTRNDCVFEEVDREKVENEMDRALQEGADVFEGDLFVA